tara:strand:+ start:134 stop:973 length:840 start_codon:yes stop_codon:yes gene_type:complete
MIIWLASYPKSGNTFLRSLLASYYFSEDGKFTFDILKNIQQFPNVELFNKIGVNLNDKYEIAKNYIKTQELINKSNNLQFWKTHSSFCKMYNKFNFSDLKNSLGAIYLVRDPRNVITSFANHNSKKINETADLLLNDLATGNEKNDVEVYMGSWAFNFNSWKIYKSSNKYLLVKYEDLVTDTKKVFLDIVEFINKLSKNKLLIDYNKIEKVIETTNFKYMKNLEHKYGFDEAKINDKTGKKVNFFNLGPNNNWKKLLDNKNRKKIEKKFQKEMVELGYI